MAQSKKTEKTSPSVSDDSVIVELSENEESFDKNEKLVKSSTKVSGKKGAKGAQVDEKMNAEQEKRYKFLLGQTDLFQHFIKAKKEGKSPFQVLMNEAAKEKKQSNNGVDSSIEEDHRHHHRKSEKEEDAELIKEDVEDEEVPSIITHFTESPSYVEGGTMRPYQIEGLNWLISLFEHGINGILADEMGLGKTLQTLSLLGYMKFYRDIPGPHLLVVPKSTLQNWLNESRRWVPGLNSFILHGSKEERDTLIKERLLTRDFDICITSFEIVMLEKSAFRKINWKYLIIDEAHRIKNENSMLSQIVREFHTSNRLLITGTPLQNNLHELWALLNFLLPDIFSSSDDFDSWFSSEGASPVEETGDSEGSKPEEKTRDQELMMQQLRRLLQPFLLRRLKADVEHSLKPKKEVNLYVNMSEMQRRWYQKILERDLDAVSGLSKGKEGKTRLLNIVMQLRKCANHPYLFDGAEPGPPFTTDLHLVENSGKMVVLDRLLAKMKANGSRVLLFSQMSRMLDILEDYCAWRGWEYCRIDGQTDHADRIEAIEEYNKPNSKKFIFLLTTRAGGLGINLATADIVILYDSDWNPQVDLQAQDRAHRIGQQKQVCVFRLITENSVEEKVIERALQKLRLDQLVIQQGRMANANKPLSQEEMLSMIRHGADKILRGKTAQTASIMDDSQIEELLRRGEERTRELMGKYSNAGFDDLQKFSIAQPSLYSKPTDEDGGAGDESSNPLGDLRWLMMPSKRERKTVFGEFGASEQRTSSRGVGGQSDKIPMPRLPTLHDYQFYPTELHDLFQKEILHYQKEHGYRIPAVPAPGDLEETSERKKEREAEQRLIDEARPLTDKEVTLKEKLLAQGFGDWSRRDYQGFLRGCERYGRDSFAEIAAEIGNESKTATQVRAYSKVFWQKVDELPDADKIVSVIEKGEARLKRNLEIEQILAEKVARSDSAGHFSIPYSAAGKGKQFTPEEDEFLLRELHRLGYSTDPALLYPQIHTSIMKSPVFKFDFFLKTRTTTELSRRCNKLIAFIEKEEADLSVSRQSGKKRTSSVGSVTGSSTAVDADEEVVTRRKRSANKESWEKLAEKAAMAAMSTRKRRSRN